MQCTPIILQTPCGVRFGLIGSDEKAPAPTLFVFAKSLEESLSEEDYFEIGRLVTPHGYRCVSLDLPCHGQDVRPGEAHGLDGWRARIESGEEVIARFVMELSAVLDYLVKEGWTDAARVAACGTSRGGLIALHFAAADPRVKSVVAFAPVVDLAGVPGFGGMEDHAGIASLQLTRFAPRLGETAIWLSIGHDDRVVDTDKVIAFARAVVATDVQADVELHVIPTPGHTTPPGAHRVAAAWLLERTVANSQGVMQSCE